MEEINDKQIEALLKAHGIRLTANRILIARTLSGLDNPASMKELEAKIQTIDKSNIFRTLSLFKQQHLVHQLEDGNDIVRYELCLSDDDALCRVWSASSLMQMSFHGVSKEEICEASKDAFAKVLADEKDMQACGLILESVQTLFGKKWVSSSAVENVDEVKIEKGRKSALRFLSKL